MIKKKVETVSETQKLVGDLESVKESIEGVYDNIKESANLLESHEGQLQSVIDFANATIRDAEIIKREAEARLGYTRAIKEKLNDL